MVLFEIMREGLSTIVWARFMETIEPTLFLAYRPNRQGEKMVTRRREMVAVGWKEVME